MTQDLAVQSEKRDYGALFRFDLNWGAPDHPPVTLRLDDGTTLTATNVSSYRGLRVWEVPALPGSTVEAQLDQLIAKTTTHRLVIFHQDDKQAWRWPSRRNTAAGVISRPARHVHKTETSDPGFAAKLEAIRLPDDILLDVNAVLAKVRGAFDVESKNETKRASRLMARMYTALEKRYPTGFSFKQRDHEISVSLARVLFLLFGDDTEMWNPDLFQDFIKEYTARDGSDIGQRLNELFVLLDTAPGDRGELTTELAAFPYINGGIFDERVTLPTLDLEFRTAVLDAAAVDWSTISPAIFGSMFQSVRDSQTRRELGEHYTSEENILKTLNPLFLDALRAEFDAAIRRDTDQKKKNALNALWDKLGEIRYMDPACGCGNFIIVAYRELRSIELDIMLALQNLSGDSQLSFDPTLSLKVTLDHFYGIEVDEWPARIAETAMFLIDRQCDLKLKERFGEAPKRLPIQTQSTIVVHSALTLDWTDILPASDNAILAGNPPFLGISLRSAEQTSELQVVWGERYHGTLDYVTGWHAKALDYFRHRNGRWAFVSTNSITQGEVVAPLFGAIFNEGWKIQFAHRTFRWTSEAVGGAAVHCVIVGFSKDAAKPRLFEYTRPDAQPVEQVGIRNITPYLTDGPTVVVRPSTKPLNPQLGEVAYGNKPTDDGNLIVEPADYDHVTADPIASKYVRKYVGARELLHDGERYCLWLVDAATRDLTLSPVLRGRVEGVRAFRAASRAASTREAAATAHLFRQIAQPDTAYLCIPRHVSESRPYFLSNRYPADVICSDANFLSPDPDGFVFAVISSTMFITWQRTVGGRIKSDLRFNKLLTWNTFPLPPTDEEARRRVIEAGDDVLKARQSQPGSVLADMYITGAMPADLLDAHRTLDREVDRLFALKSAEPTELDRQDVLFARYQELTAPLLTTAAPRKRARR